MSHQGRHANTARQKIWPGADAALLRNVKRNFADHFAEEEPPPPINVEKLNEHLAMPDWRSRIIPLCMYRGTSDAYRIRAMQNAAYAMFLAESETFSAGIRLLPASGLGHSCGFHASPQHSSLRGIFGRLRGNKIFTDSISKAFTEYVEWIHPWPCVLTPVPRLSNKRSQFAWWRAAAPYASRIVRAVATSDLAYPYIRSAPLPQHEMLLKVHGLIPGRITGDLRADLCQDLFVAILSGDLTVENVPDAIPHYAQQARMTAPDRWKNISMSELDERIGIKKDDHGCALDFVRHQDDFAPDLCDLIDHHEIGSGVPAAFWEQEKIVVRRTFGPDNFGPTREKECGNKQRYESLADAQTASHVHSGSNLNAYQCRYCRGFHYGHAMTDGPVFKSKHDRPIKPGVDRIRHERPHWKTLRGEWGDWSTRRASTAKTTDTE